MSKLKTIELVKSDYEISCMQCEFSESGDDTSTILNSVMHHHKQTGHRDVDIAQETTLRIGKKRID